MHRIVLVEDDPTMLSLLQTLLQMEGYEVIKNPKETIEDILELFRAEKPELALIDVHLRNASGFDVLRGVKQAPELKDTRVLMSSGMDFSAECLAQGADGFILKPYMPDELIRKIHEMVSG